VMFKSLWTPSCHQTSYSLKDFRFICCQISHKYHTVNRHILTPHPRHAPNGGGIPGCSPFPNRNLKTKTQIRWTWWYQTLYVIYPSAISATEVVWWLEHYNFEKYNNKLREPYMNYKKIWWVSRRTRSYIQMYINAVSNNVMLQLYLLHDFITAFKIKNSL
jgi:hypothetical protein